MQKATARGGCKNQVYKPFKKEENYFYEKLDTILSNHSKKKRTIFMKKIYTILSNHSKKKERKKTK